MAEASSKADIDLIRFGYVLKKSLDGLDIGYRQISKIAGVSVRQISHAVHGKRISAGATHMLCVVCQINFEEMLTADNKKRLEKIRKVQQETELEQGVTPLVKRETPVNEVAL